MDANLAAVKNSIGGVKFLIAGRYGLQQPSKNA